MISDCVSLSDKLRRPVWAFIAEDGTVDAPLAAGIDEFAPDKEGIGVPSSQNNLRAWSGEEDALSAVSVSVARVVALIEREA
jgi:hypothetical protein